MPTCTSVLFFSLPITSRCNRQSSACASIQRRFLHAAKSSTPNVHTVAQSKKINRGARSMPVGSTTFLYVTKAQGSFAGVLPGTTSWLTHSPSLPHRHQEYHHHKTRQCTTTSPHPPTSNELLNHAIISPSNAAPDDTPT